MSRSLRFRCALRERVHARKPILTGVAYAVQFESTQENMNAEQHLGPRRLYDGRQASSTWVEPAAPELPFAQVLVPPETLVRSSSLTDAKGHHFTLVLTDCALYEVDNTAERSLREAKPVDRSPEADTQKEHAKRGWLWAFFNPAPKGPPKERRGWQQWKLGGGVVMRIDLRLIENVEVESVQTAPSRRAATPSPAPNGSQLAHVTPAQPASLPILPPTQQPPLAPPPTLQPPALAPPTLAPPTLAPPPLAPPPLASPPLAPPALAPPPLAPPPLAPPAIGGPPQAPPPPPPIGGSEGVPAPPPPPAPPPIGGGGPGAPPPPVSHAVSEPDPPLP